MEKDLLKEQTEKFEELIREEGLRIVCVGFDNVPIKRIN